MVNKVLFVLLGTTLAGVLFPVGCICPKSELNSFEIYIGTLSGNTVFSYTDSVHITLYLNWDRIYANNQLPTSNLFTQNAYAFSCADEIGTGIKDIKITCNKEFLDIAPGNSIEQKLSCFNGELYIDDCVRTELAHGNEAVSGLAFLFTYTPDPSDYVFDIRLTDDADNMFFASSDTVTWEY
ncbi:hypothetical protein C7N43_24465 [Sphingobacteriales bacterium UPWRP_1]|nr:hypothetical protein BVG80_16805 [Sphingobacteriales bacterium TSM_CSM]PSJ74360.1 hypothetical protein C7N43_24465 [Sphingobacteriales bacterium UPWRP_1]